MAYRWGFIGCGNLAQAIIQGLISKNVILPNLVSATDVQIDKLDSFAKLTGINASRSVEDLLQRSDIIVLATKPQDLLPVVHSIGPLLRTDQMIVSLAAGISSQVFVKNFEKSRAIFRVMANTPALVQKGVFGILCAKQKSKELETIKSAFGALGLVVIAKDDKAIDAITSGSAGGPGFIFSFMEQFEGFFIKKGFSKIDSRKMAVETFLGSAVLAKESPKNISELREAVTSKKGTTLEGLRTMKKLRVPQSITAGLNAAVKRATELSKEFRK